MTRLLVVEDNPGVKDLLTNGLTAEGYHVDSCTNGASALQKAGVDSYPILILDRMLPDTDGIVVCRKLRERGYDGHILFLTAKDATSDRVEGLKAGADDYICKPFDFEELLARLEALQRGDNKQYDHSEDSSVLVSGDLEINMGDRSVRHRGYPIELTKREFQLLHFFIANDGKVLSRAEILSGVWGYSFEPGTKLVEVYVRYLRKKFDADTGDESTSIIESVRGLGYRLRAGAIQSE